VAALRLVGGPTQPRSGANAEATVALGDLHDYIWRINRSAAAGRRTDTAALRG